MDIKAFFKKIFSYESFKMIKYFRLLSVIFVFKNPIVLCSENATPALATEPYKIGIEYQWLADNQNESVGAQANIGTRSLRFGGGFVSFKDSHRYTPVGTVGLLALVPFGTSESSLKSEHLAKVDLLVNEKGYYGARFLSGYTLTLSDFNSRIGTLVGVTNTKSSNWKTIPVIGVSTGLDFNL